MPGHELARRYEDLRSWALGAPMAMTAARGLALFLRRGLPAWIEAWVQHTPATPTAAPHEPTAPHPPAPQGLSLDVARVLANMVLLGRGRARA